MNPSSPSSTSACAALFWNSDLSSRESLRLSSIGNPTTLRACRCLQKNHWRYLWILEATKGGAFALDAGEATLRSFKENTVERRIREKESEVLWSEEEAKKRAAEREAERDRVYERYGWMD